MGFAQSVRQPVHTHVQIVVKVETGVVPPTAILMIPLTVDNVLCILQGVIFLVPMEFVQVVIHLHVIRIILFVLIVVQPQAIRCTAAVEVV
jgi:hypothetical protein